MATNIPPHNLRELNEGIQWALASPTLPREQLLEELIARIPGPDFPTGALIVGRRGIDDAYRTGRGSITMRAVIDIEEDNRGRTCLVITELPYQVNPTTCRCGSLSSPMMARSPVLRIFAMIHPTAPDGSSSSSPAGCSTARRSQSAVQAHAICGTTSVPTCSRFVDGVPALSASTNSSRTGSDAARVISGARYRLRRPRNVPTFCGHSSRRLMRSTRSSH